MQNQKFLIDNSLFNFKCLTIGKKHSPIFTYRTNKKWIAKIVQEYFEFLSILCNAENPQKEFISNDYYHCHSLDKDDQINILSDVFKAYKYPGSWIDSTIRQSPLYQIKFGSAESRLIFIKEPVKNNIIIIKPLILDINHLLYSDKKFSKFYNQCLVCHKDNC